MAVASGVSRGIGPIAAISLDGRIGRRWYMQHKKRNESESYWPGIDSEDVVPDQDVERGDLEVPKWIGNGFVALIPLPILFPFNSFPPPRPRLPH